ncbi:MAG TPA: SPFH domain-containing protein [Roseiflexaceae bacterium]|nr:SPFH domain-containing protein [Roseiflexaceae bacterium]
MRDFFFGAAGAFFLALIVMPILMGLLRAFGLYTIVSEGTCKVYVLFGKVVNVLDQPGLYFLPLKLGLNAFIVNWLGRCYVLDMRLDQRYLRSQAVNSEEGAPMGVGIWYEMYISDPVAYLFRNSDPQGSLAANVSNAAVRSLSNMPLAEMLEDRHSMSRAVRGEVSPKSAEWGYKLGSIYIRKVHLRDIGMIRQIEAKVVNRLRQVTSAIRQDGANQVSIITSTAERQAAIEFAKAQATRPAIVGAALNKIAQDPQISDALFEILEIQNLAESHAAITLVPQRSELMTQLLAAGAPAQLPSPAQGPAQLPGPVPTNGGGRS